jgi:predicted cation transporter
LLAGLIIVLLLVLSLPFVIKPIERNLEPFLFVMGLAATIIAGVLNWELVTHIMSNTMMYMITAAVFVFGLLFVFFQNQMHIWIKKLLEHIPLSLFVFLLVTILGLVSSMITAIIAALILAEVVNALPLKRKAKIHTTIIGCFAIGLGAALTPIGEPLATIVVSKLDENFFYLLKLLGIFIIPGVVAMGLVGTFTAGGLKKQEQFDTAAVAEGESTHNQEEQFDTIAVAEGDLLHSQQALSEQSEEEPVDLEDETISGVVLRAGKIFLFVMALELLGAGFKPMIDAYIINLDGRILYWINMISAVLDNATLAAAEISPSMSSLQIEAILMGLLVSGGMLIPGNIPNIISASKLKITSSEWAKLGVPVGLTMMVIYYLIIFVIL